MSRKVIAYGAGLVALIACVVIYMNRSASPKQEPLTLPGGTVYYKGPFKGKSGEFARDNLNPDIEGVEGPPSKPNERKTP